MLGSHGGGHALIIRAALAYFGIVFACAFLFGIVRVLLLAPATGAMAAVEIEIPLILMISWLAATWVIARFGVAARMGARLAMGGLAFGILMLAEAGLALVAFGTPWRVYAADLASGPGLLGLAGQLAFALVPALRLAVLRR